MKTCSYCGASVDKLALGRRCHACERERKKDWADANRVHVREQQAARREAKHDEIAEYHRAWREAHGRGGLGHVSGEAHPKFQHGRSRTREYQSWLHAKLRCTDKTDSQWPNYGGRGIRMCDEWLESFTAFFEHVGKCPSRHHQIDRINNNGNYEPGNVKWSTRRQQARNRRTTKLTDAQVDEVYRRAVAGERTTDLANEYGIHQSYVSHIKRRRAPK